MRADSVRTRSPWPDILIFPVAFFSPLWLFDDRKEKSEVAHFRNFEDFFRPFNWWFKGRRPIASYREFFPGAFTYHWHGLWSSPEVVNSFAGIVAKSLEGELASAMPALMTLPAFGGSK